MTWENNLKITMAEVTQLILMLKEKGIFTQGDIDELLERSYKYREVVDDNYHQYLNRGTKRAFKVIDGGPTEEPE